MPPRRGEYHGILPIVRLGLQDNRTSTRTNIVSFPPIAEPATHRLTLTHAPAGLKMQHHRVQHQTPTDLDIGIRPRDEPLHHNNLALPCSNQEGRLAFLVPLEDRLSASAKFKGWTSAGPHPPGNSLPMHSVLSDTSTH